MPRLQSAITPPPVPVSSATPQAAAKPVQLPPAPASTEPVPASAPAGDGVKLSPQGSATPTVSLLSEPPRPQFIDHVVKRNETLGKIAQQHLGSFDKNMLIFNANRDQLDNPDDLRIGMTLKIPVPAGSQPAKPPVQPTQPVKPPEQTVQPPAGQPVTPTTPITPEPAKPAVQYTVRRGDSLSSIALATLGDSERYMEIYQANRNIMKDPDALHQGMVLTIPGEKTRSGKPAQVTAPAVPLDISGLTPEAQELAKAMQNYQQYHAKLGNTDRTKTTPTQILEIAKELDSAAKAFNVDPKMMLAVYAHESGGINPGARSHTGAGGLGQLTSVAIRQVHFMAGIGKGHGGVEPYNQHKDNFVQSTRAIRERYDIKANVWTSVAYMSYELNERAGLGKGIAKALKRYGDPNVSTYANKVNAEYQTLFGGKLF